MSEQPDWEIQVFKHLGRTSGAGADGAGADEAGMDAVGTDSPGADEPGADGAGAEVSGDARELDGAAVHWVQMVDVEVMRTVETLGVVRTFVTPLSVTVWPAGQVVTVEDTMTVT